MFSSLKYKMIWKNKFNHMIYKWIYIYISFDSKNYITQFFWYIIILPIEFNLNMIFINGS
jgi:hypothetical protein